MGVSLKKSVSMMFLSFTASTESSDLNLVPFTLKKPETSPGKSASPATVVHAADAVLSKKEVLGFVFVNLLHSLQYVNIKDKKLASIGAALMRQGDYSCEEQLLLLYELARNGLMEGRPLTPLGTPIILPQAENYLSTAM